MSNVINLASVREARLRQQYFGALVDPLLEIANSLGLDTARYIGPNDTVLLPDLILDTSRELGKVIEQLT